MINLAIYSFNLCREIAYNVEHIFQCSHLSLEMFQLHWRRYTPQQILQDLGTGICTSLMLDLASRTTFLMYSFVINNCLMFFVKLLPWTTVLMGYYDAPRWNSNIVSFAILQKSQTLSLPSIRNTVDGNPKWCCTYLLDPSDPLFVEIGEAFILKQIRGKHSTAVRITSDFGFGFA